MPLNKETKDKVIQDFKIDAQDTGSAFVQIALLSERIKMLTEHLKENKKDFSSKQGLLKLISQRNKLMKYAKRKNATEYKKTTERLNLKG